MLLARTATLVGTTTKAASDSRNFKRTGGLTLQQNSIQKIWWFQKINNTLNYMIILHYTSNSTTYL